MESLDFEVTQPLPNITFPLNRNFAGNIPVDRTGHPNNTLFFWGVEKTQGSLTSPAGPLGDSPAPWGIWLNGGHVFISLISYSKTLMFSTYFLGQDHPAWLASYLRYTPLSVKPLMQLET